MTRDARNWTFFAITAVLCIAVGVSVGIVLQPSHSKPVAPQAVQQRQASTDSVNGIDWPNWIIAGLTAALTGIGFAQWRIYRQARDHTVVIERGYLSISHERPGLTFGFVTSGSNDPVSRQDVDLVWKLTNTGRTPITVNRILIQPIVAERLDDVQAGILPVYDEALGERTDMLLRIPVHREHAFRFNVSADSADGEHRFRSS